MPSSSLFLVAFDLIVRGPRSQGVVIPEDDATVVATVRRGHAHGAYPLVRAHAHAVHGHGVHRVDRLHRVGQHRRRPHRAQAAHRRRDGPHLHRRRRRMWQRLLHLR